MAILRAITARAGTCPFLDLWEKQQGRVGTDLWGGPSWSNKYKPGKFHCPKAKREEKVSPSISYGRKEERGRKVKQGNFSELKTLPLCVRGGEAFYPGGWWRTWNHFREEKCPQQVFREVPQLKSQPWKQAHRVSTGDAWTLACVMLTDVAEE